jgi:hypothetical protein
MEQQRAEIRALALSREGDELAGESPGGRFVDSLEDSLPDDLILAELRRYRGTNADNH